MVVASSSTPGALTRVGAAAAGAALSVVVVLIALPNVRRPGWLNGSLIFWYAGASPDHPRRALLVVCAEGRPRGESGGHRGHMERRRMGGRPELRPRLHRTSSYLAGRQSGAVARHSSHRSARLCVWRARRPWDSNLANVDKRRRVDQIPSHSVRKDLVHQARKIPLAEECDRKSCDYRPCEVRKILERAHG